MEKIKANTKTVRVLVAPNFRILAQSMNELGISKNDVIKITKDEGQYLMLYQM